MRQALPRRKHLRRLERISVPEPVLFLLTISVAGRRQVLADHRAHSILVDAWLHSESAHGWLTGRYVVMPEHVHFFASPAGGSSRSLSAFISYWKRSTANRIRDSIAPAFRWQAEFFDHLLRSHESYGQKWEYVRLNPVRAGLVAEAKDWPYQGEISVLHW